MKASISFFPNVAKKNSKTGLIPMYMRICFQRTKAESRLNAEVTEQELVKWNPLTIRFDDRNSAVNHLLNRLAEKFKDFTILNSTSLPDYSADYIKGFVLGLTKNKKNTLLNFVDNFFEDAVCKNVDRKPGTIKNYRRGINHLIKFLQHRNQKGLLLDELDYEFAYDFKNYLVSQNPTIKVFKKQNESTYGTVFKAGMTEVSAAGVIKKFRTILNQAVELELIKRNPFKLVKIKTKSPRKERLSIHQVKLIWNTDLSNFQYQVIYRDIFLFSVFSGLAYHDLMSLTWNNLEKRQDGNVKLSISRQKSEILTESFLPSYAIEIAKRYEGWNETQILKTVLPKRSNKELNSQLKLLANLARITIKLG